MRSYVRLLLALPLLLLPAALAVAQSPSTDVLPKRSVYVEFDFNSHLSPFRDGGYQTYASRFVFGVSRDVEAGVNVEFSNPVVPDQGVELQPNIKWQFHNDERRGTAASLGAVLFLPAGRRAGTDTFGMVYGNFSKQFHGRFGPRFTGGGYFLPKRAGGLGARGGVTLSYAQPLADKVSFGVDWVGGNNRFGFVTPGLTFAVSRRSQLFVGYAVGNEGRRNNELAVAYGIEF